MNSIEVKQLSFSFGKQEVLQSVSFSVKAGEIVGIVGKNGSGKSVFFKLLAGLIKPTQGEIWIDGVEIGSSSVFAKNMGILIEEPSFLAELTACQNLELLRSIQDTSPKEVVDRALRAVGLEEHMNQKVKYFSLGMKKKIGIAQAIMESPRILLLDEPMNALDEDSIQSMRKLIQQLSNKGVAIVIASHNREDIDLLCHRVYKIEQRRLVVES